MNESESLNDEVEQPLKHGLFSRIKTWIKRIVIAVLSLVVIYAVIALLGLIPVNNDFVETENGIEIFVFSGEFHSDIILPVQNEVCDWRTKFPVEDIANDTIWASHIAFGWGDREFYINTPSWKDLKVSTAINALLIPSKTVVHVAYANEPLEGSQIKSVTISEGQYKRLVEFVENSFARNSDQSVQAIPNEAYGSYDAFYVGSGSYHAFRTCNCWVGEALKATGVKTGWFTPLPKTVFFYFP